MRTSRIISTAALALFGAGIATSAHAQATIDGTAEAFYGAARSTQTNYTQFGDNVAGVTGGGGGGSELDQAFARIQGGILYLSLTGNLEANSNRLAIYFDTVAGGQNVLRNDNVSVDNNGLNAQAGLTFDAGFAPDFYIAMNSGDGVNLSASYATLPTTGAGTGGLLGTTTFASNGVFTGGTVSNGIRGTFNNINTLGVNGNAATSPTGAGVVTGAEFAIPLSALGLPTGAFNVSAFVNGSNNDFLSNQVLGSLPSGTANLGNPPSTVNFANQAGTQSFSVPAAAVPEPSALALLAPGFAGLGLIIRRRKSVA